METDKFADAGKRAQEAAAPGAICFTVIREQSPRSASGAKSKISRAFGGRCGAAANNSPACSVQDERRARAEHLRQRRSNLMNTACAAQPVLAVRMTAPKMCAVCRGSTDGKEEAGKRGGARNLAFEC